MRPWATIRNRRFFADGLVEDILTTLSKLSGLSVIARNSSFVYKGRAVDVRQIARELGVRFVLEGSVRKAGNRIRITAQLIDAATGAHVWADRFDRSVDDIFAVQDEITLTLATEMQVRLTEGEQARMRYTTTTNVEAWSLWIQGLNYYRGPKLRLAFSDPPLLGEGARARSRLSCRSTPCSAMSISPMLAMVGAGRDRETAMKKAEGYIERALEIDPENPDAHRAQRNSAAQIAVRRSSGRSPQGGETRPQPARCTGLRRACTSLFRSRREGIGLIEKAFTLSPNYHALYLGVLGNAYRLAGRSEEAIVAFRAYHARAGLRARRHRHDPGASRTY